MVWICFKYLVESSIYISVSTSLTQLWRTCSKILCRSKSLWKLNAESLGHAVRIELALTWEGSSKTSLDRSNVAHDIANSFFHYRLTILHHKEFIALLCHLHHFFCRYRVL